MKDKLRELAERWSNRDYDETDHLQGYAEGIRQASNELLAILDAEGDGGTPLPGVVWNERTNSAHLIKRGTEVEFCAEYGCCRVFTHPARSGVVSDEDVEAACAIYFGGRHWPHGVEEVELVRISMRAALEHFAKGSDEDVRDAAEIFAGTNAALSNLTVRKNNQEKTS